MRHLLAVFGWKIRCVAVTPDTVNAATDNITFKQRILFQCICAGHHRGDAYQYAVWRFDPFGDGNIHR